VYAAAIVVVGNCGNYETEQRRSNQRLKRCGVSATLKLDDLDPNYSMTCSCPAKGGQNQYFDEEDN
jgi:hypothetical protein